MPFSHDALQLNENKKLVFTAMSKHLFYFRMFISTFVLKQNAVPLNPFMTFDYFLLDAVDRDIVREANNNLVKRADELWVFGAVSNGVLAEIKIASGLNKPIKYFKIIDSKEIVPVLVAEIEMEEEVEKYRHELPSE